MLLRTLAVAFALIAVPLAVQAMSQQPAGPGRTNAAEAAREALLETQQAMLQLPG